MALPLAAVAAAKNADSIFPQLFMASLHCIGKRGMGTGACRSAINFLNFFFIFIFPLMGKHGLKELPTGLVNNKHFTDGFECHDSGIHVAGLLILLSSLFIFVLCKK
jgi:hypothetical protein